MYHASNTPIHTVPKWKGEPALNSFTTGTTQDHSPPSWKGVSGTRYIRDRDSGSNCSSGEPYVLIDIASSAISDDQTPAEDVVYGVWPATGPLDHGSLLTMTRAWNTQEIVLGWPSRCSTSNFTVPSTRPARFRVAPIDLAGNIGPAAEITIDPSRPERLQR